MYKCKRGRGNSVIEQHLNQGAQLYFLSNHAMIETKIRSYWYARQISRPNSKGLNTCQMHFSMLCSVFLNFDRFIPNSGSLLLSANTSSCSSTPSEIRRLEHVQINVTLQHRHRGDLSITLISPSGTRSKMLTTRRNDHSALGLKVVLIAVIVVLCLNNPYSLELCLVYLAMGEVGKWDALAQ